jgi:mannosyl-oligosaccharide alpha-1,2-mannosidase
MLLIRRFYLLPAFLVTCAVYLLLYRSRQAPSPPIKPVPIDAENRLHWHKRPERYPVTSFIPLPTGPAASIPKIQHPFSVAENVLSRNTRLERRDAIKSTFLRSWTGYKTYAWGKDEVSPISGTWRSSFGGWGATLVDTMDTLWIMGMKDDFEQCVQAVEAVDFSTNEEETLNVFETTIRYQGGLLAAHDLSDGKYPILLKKAQELGEMLYTAFDTPHRMPIARWLWKMSASGQELEPGETTLLAEFGSLTLEFTRLAQLTGEAKYFDAVQRISNELQRMQNETKLPGLWPVVVDIKSWPATAKYNHFTLGGMADSTYEYLPKEYLMLAGKGEEGQGYRRMYEDTIDMVEKHIFFRPMTEKGDDVLLSGNIAVSKDKVIQDPQGQHLACFTGGMVGMGAKIFDRPDDIEVAKRLVAGCVWAYKAMPSGLMPETFHVVPCHIGVSKADSSECEWSEPKWYQAIRDRHHLETQSEVPTQQELEEFAKARKLQPGFSDIGDRRYILRQEIPLSSFAPS